VSYQSDCYRLLNDGNGLPDYGKCNTWAWFNENAEENPIQIPKVAGIADLWQAVSAERAEKVQELAQGHLQRADNTG